MSVGPHFFPDLSVPTHSAFLIMLSGRLTLTRVSPPGPGHSFRAVVGCGDHVVLIPRLASGECVPFQIRVDPATCGDKLSVIAYERDQGHPLAAVAGYAFFTLGGDLAHVPVVVSTPRPGQMLLDSKVPVITTADEDDVKTAEATISDILWTDAAGVRASHPNMSAIYHKLDDSVEHMSSYMAAFDPYSVIDRDLPPLDTYNGKAIHRPSLIKNGKLSVFEVPGALVDGKRANFPIAFYFEPMQDGMTGDDYLRHLLVLAGSRYACEAARLTGNDYRTFMAPEEILALPAPLLARVYGMAVALPSCSRQYNSDHILTTRTETEIENFGSPVNSGTDDCDGFAWLSAWTHREMLLRANSPCPLLRRVASEIATQYHEIPVLTTSTSAASTHSVSRESEHSAIHLVLALVRKDIVASWTEILGTRDDSNPLPGVMYCEGTANNEPWWRMAKDLAADDYELHRRRLCETLYALADTSGISGYRRYTEARVVSPGPFQYEHPFYRIGILALVPTPGGLTHYTEHAFVTGARHGAVLESLEDNHHVTLIATRVPEPRILQMAKTASCLIPRSLVPRCREEIEMKTSPFSVKGHACVPFIFTRGCPNPAEFHRLGHPFVHFTEHIDSETSQDVVLVYPPIK